ncbi:14535_t:CDS:2 [Cetraspora pellucida]|uniref:14535_t:CDS:1 n=1 Tax=Cetraspora pellucida TaxID=1433469 RepID=A0A9N9ASQ9_9GLOM|nr:14535_t:CDS:2 [Cetraspora pellucida]
MSKNIYQNQKNKTRSVPILEKPANIPSDSSEASQYLLNFNDQSLTKLPSNIPEMNEDNGGFFNKYKDEKIEEVESYHTDEAMADEKDLFTNLWRNKYSSAIYLTTIKEFPTAKRSNKPKLTFEKTI